MNQPSGAGDGHLDALQIAAFLDRGLSPAEYDRIETHLAECGECLRHVVETDELLKRVRRPKRLSIAGAVILAAASVALVAVASLRTGGSAGEAPAYRDSPQTSSLLAYGPMGESPLKSVRFVWGSVSGAMSYRLTVTNADGETVWTHSGSDTVVTLPGLVRLRAGNRYVWVADAILSGGGSRSTGLREFVPTR